ncbi:MAG: hypothetical protein IT434_15535 [Phycisphaerales bacterium]|nr:hypothetical protein [Phycisphaerales bacterium]
MTDSPKPIRHVRRGMIQAAVWRNLSAENGVYFTVTFERLYRNDQQKWQHTQGFSRDDLLLLAKVANLAQDAIFELQEAERGLHGPTNGNAGAPLAARAAHGRA